jgi:hypothetical protein
MAKTVICMALLAVLSDHLLACMVLWPMVGVSAMLVGLAFIATGGNVYTESMRVLQVRSIVEMGPISDCRSQFATVIRVILALRAARQYHLPQ